MSSGDGKRRRVLSDEERVLWTTVTKTMAPLKGAAAPENVQTSVAAPARPSAPTVKSPRNAPPIAEKKALPPLTALGRRAKQRVARGKEPIEGRLDLHGLTQREAHTTLLRFLNAATLPVASLVLVITGQGGVCQDERPLLERQVPHSFVLP